MKPLFVAVVLNVTIASAILSGAMAQPVIYIVRHVEKLPAWLGDDFDDFHPLSEIGIKRAQLLADSFAPESLAAVFCSPTTRTLHTALPLAQKLGVPVELAEACWDTTAIDAFYSSLKNRFAPDQAVLLISHSNIIPYLLMRAGLRPSCWKEMGITASSEVAEMVIEGYDNLWKIMKPEPVQKDCTNFSRRRF